MKKVFAIILNYNGKDTLLECLDSVYKSDYSNLEVIIVDNNSTDGSFKIAKNHFAKFHFIKNSQNIGFAGGNNVAIKFALEKMADYIFLLNNDALIKNDTISKLVKTAERNEKIGLLSPLIYKNKTNKIWFAGGKINWLQMRTEHTSNKLLKNKPLLTSYITGCAMLIKKEVFKKIGLLDEDYFLYYEDADFSYRARKNGFKVAVLPSAIAYHFEKSNENNPQKLYWLIRSGILFFQKNAPWFWQPYIKIYLWARKLKNKQDIKSGKNIETALQIQKAYQQDTPPLP